MGHHVRDLHARQAKACARLQCWEPVRILLVRSSGFPSNGRLTLAVLARCVALRFCSSLSGAFWLVGGLVVNVITTDSTAFAGVCCVRFHDAGRSHVFVYLIRAYQPTEDYARVFFLQL